MLNFICKSFVRQSCHHVHRSSASHKLHFVHQFSILSSASKRADRESFIASYLINKCGFPLENAAVSAKHLNFGKPEQPDRVISFLKNQGFSDAEVFNLVRKKPQILALLPQRNLLPKIEFLRSQQYSQTDLFFILPHIVGRSLKENIIPSFEMLTNLIGNREDTVISIKRCPKLLSHAQRMVEPNVDTLLRAGVPQEQIARFLRTYSGKILQQPERYKEFVCNVKELGMNPEKSMFLIAVMVMCQLNRETWEKKMEVYKSWGCSEEEVLTAFKLYPMCMKVSVDKIGEVLEYLVNELGWSVPMLMKTPLLFSYSLKRRIIPRCSVYNLLLARGLTKAQSCLVQILRMREEKFLADFVIRYEKEAPELMEVYQEKLKQHIMSTNRVSRQVF